MSYSVDQFMQVKCKLQLTSESESSESIHNNCEQVRLCVSAELDKNSTLIAMVCSNETSNNNILIYYIERRPSTDGTHNEPMPNHDKFHRDRNDKGATSQCQPPQVRSTSCRTRPKIIVKQIYYHSYNEDLVGLSLTHTATKLILINSASTIYILPIKNILLNLHAQQLRSSQGKSMYFYDAKILSNLRSIKDPIDIVCWQSLTIPERSYIVVACKDGHRLVFLDVEEKREICSTSVNEPIRNIEIVRDRFSHSLLITCESCNQYRLTLELLKQDQDDVSAQSASAAKPSIINLPKAFRHLGSIDDETILSERDFTPSWTSKPIPIRLNSTGSMAGGAIQRVFTPASRFGSQASLSAAVTSGTSERSRALLFSLPPNLIGIVDILGASQQPTSQSTMTEPRLLRFYSNKQYFYRSQRPQVICKLDSLESEEKITHLALTERFIALATDRHRCVIYSRNCCKLKNPTPQAPIRMDPLVKEVTFNHEERILSLLKSPATYDQDNILDSFILVTTRCIYSIDARHNCRDLFINLIDSHLAIKRTLFTPRTQVHSLEETSLNVGLSDGPLLMNDHLRARSAESNLLIGDFLQHREVYERICHDSLAFSNLFKLELSSLYEAYADRLLQRHQFELANRFFVLASFDHSRILGKYVRIGAYKEMIEYVKVILSDENDFRKVLAENERLELAKIAFECLLAKTLVERSKVVVYKTKLKPGNVTFIAGRVAKDITDIGESRPIGEASKFDMFRLCEHSPKCQSAKLSTTTIVGGVHEDDEETLTSNTEGDDYSQRRSATQRYGRIKAEKRLECEKALIEFIEQLMPSSLYEYVVDRLLDFDLLELIDPIAHTDMQILTFVKALIRSRDNERLLFRTGKMDSITEKLESLHKIEVVKINTRSIEFLEFITSPRVTHALVRDISLTCDFYGYQHTLVQFRKYSFAALRHLETYRSLITAYTVGNHSKENQALINGRAKNEALRSSEDDNANDGVSFASKTNVTLFDEQHKHIVETIFLEFLTACLEESTEDSCRLWFNYINFYLNYIGDLNALESDILKLMDTSRDCRLAISLYKAIYREETAKSIPNKNGSGKTGERKLIDGNIRNMNTFLKANLIANTPLEAMKELHNLANLFANDFLMRLLERTLDLLPQSPDLDALTIATMC